jgi:hypothetical protein
VQRFATHQKPPPQARHHGSPDGREGPTGGRHKGPNHHHAKHTPHAQQTLLSLQQEEKHQRHQGDVVPTDSQQVRQPQLLQGMLDIMGHGFFVTCEHAQRKT